MLKFRVSTLAILLLVLFAQPAQARDQIRVVGSSTVYPFMTVIAEQFGRKTSFKTPVVESTGTGAGFKLFCAGSGSDTPDVSNASRRIKPKELLECYKNNVMEIAEIKFGFDGIVIANAAKAYAYDFKLQDLFLALAKKVPSKTNPNMLVDNFYKTWDEINPAFPKKKIQVYGPPPTSGTRDAFAELVMEAGCWDVPAYKAQFPENDLRKQACHEVREDGAYIEAGENDNLIVQKLASNPDSLGIFGYSFLEENQNLVQGSKVVGVYPSHDTIADAQYAISRPLYVYIKRGHIGEVPGIEEFIDEIVNPDAIGAFGYLEEKGLIPLPEDQLKKVVEETKQGKLLENLAEE